MKTINLPRLAMLALAALIVALGSAAFYVGALGSTRTHAKRVARLTEAGVVRSAAFSPAATSANRHRTVTA